MIIEFYGASDDIVKVAVKDDHNVLQFDEEFMMWDSYKVAGKFNLGRIGIIAVYDGFWTFAPSLIHSDDTLPDWTYTFYRDHSYSIGLRVQTNEDVKVKRA